MLLSLINKNTAMSSQPAALLRSQLCLSKESRDASVASLATSGSLKAKEKSPSDPVKMAPQKQPKILAVVKLVGHDHWVATDQPWSEGDFRQRSSRSKPPPPSQGARKKGTFLLGFGSIAKHRKNMCYMLGATALCPW